MRRFAVIAVALTLTCVASPFANAQGKDPFRPPSGPGPGAAADPAPGSVEPPGLNPAPPGEGLARTGQDLGIELRLAAALLCLGGVLRLPGRILGGVGFGVRRQSKARS